MVATGLYAAVYLLQVAVIIRALLRPNREPSSRTAWSVHAQSRPMQLVAPREAAIYCADGQLPISVTN